jgi:hypothetical protein
MRVFPIVVLAAAALAACGSRLDRKRLHGAVEDLSSIAAEARFLTRQERGGGLPAAYAHGQREALADRSRDALSRLDRDVEDAALEPDRHAAVAAGQRVLTSLEPGCDLRELEDLQRRLDRIAAGVRP